MSLLFLILLHIGPIAFAHKWQTVYHKISQDPSLSTFNSLIQANRIAKMHLLYYNLTVFVPTNSAFTHFHGKINDILLFYHFVPYPLPFLNETQQLQCINEENPPIYVTRTAQNEIYVNNAKLLPAQTFTLSNQVMYVIDDVLDPLLRHQWPQPTALDFLTNANNWRLTAKKVTFANFATKIHQFKLDSLYNGGDGNNVHTFFIPIDPLDASQIDKYIVQAHIIPNQVLFARTFQSNVMYESAANGDYIYIVLSMSPNSSKLCSHTILGDVSHPKGDLSNIQILIGNIPMKNGVVHLIDRPLAVFDKELKPFPFLSVWYKLQADIELSESWKIGQELKLNEILQRNQSEMQFTYFVPSNTAWKHTKSKRDLLKNHLIISNTNYYTINHLIAMQAANHNDFIELDTLNGVIKMKMLQQTLSVYIQLLNGNEIKVLHSNYLCQDGIVHIVDGLFDDVNENALQSVNEYGFWRMLKDLFS